MQNDDDGSSRRAVDTPEAKPEATPEATPDYAPSSSVTKRHGGEDSRATAHTGKEDGGGARATQGRVGEILGHGRRHEDKTRGGLERVKSGHIEKTHK